MKDAIAHIDADEVTNESDLYVRDHLLIQWMLTDIGIRWDNDIEQMYEDWTNWLKKQEAQHAERSTI